MSSVTEPVTSSVPSIVELACDTKPAPKVSSVDVDTPSVVGVHANGSPPLALRSIHVPLYERQPVRRSSPSAKVEVAPLAKS